MECGLGELILQRGEALPEGGAEHGVGVVPAHLRATDLELAGDLTHGNQSALRSMRPRSLASSTIPRSCSMGLNPKVELNFPSVFMKWNSLIQRIAVANRLQLSCTTVFPASATPWLMSPR